mmetsp:Transcript_38099/g.90518  ORF Transcript_38099/g.90518 Transcript_38099/m.90518 type:complete len:207 (+) Transcript_38099:3182-3802(+)
MYAWRAWPSLANLRTPCRAFSGIAGRCPSREDGGQHFRGRRAPCWLKQFVPPFCLARRHARSLKGRRTDPPASRRPAGSVPRSSNGYRRASTTWCGAMRRCSGSSSARTSLRPKGAGLRLWHPLTPADWRRLRSLRQRPPNRGPALEKGHASSSATSALCTMALAMPIAGLSRPRLATRFQAPRRARLCAAELRSKTTQRLPRSAT